MNIYPAPFLSSLQASRDEGIKPVYFAWFEAKNRATDAVEPMGLWTGDEDITISVRSETGGLISRAYIGGCNLSVTGLQYVMDMTDNPVTISMSQIADATQQLVRGYDVRLAKVDIHAITMNGGAFSGDPEHLATCIVDDAPISTPTPGSDGAITINARSGIMHDLTATNPAKSSHAHQRRRNATDDFCKFSGVIGSRTIQGYNKGSNSNSSNSGGNSGPFG